jgi:hypothetical protein
MGCGSIPWIDRWLLRRESLAISARGPRFLVTGMVGISDNKCQKSVSTRTLPVFLGCINVGVAHLLL